MSAPLEVVGTAVAQRAAQADAAVTAAWSDHHAEVYAFLVHTTRSPEVAEDLLQEAYLRLMREARAGRTPDNVRAWLYRVAYNLAVSRGRRISAALPGLVRLSSSASTRVEEAPEAGYVAREGRPTVLGVWKTIDGTSWDVPVLLGGPDFAREWESLEWHFAATTDTAV